MPFLSAPCCFAMFSWLFRETVCSPPTVLPVGQRGQDCIQDMVEALANVFRQKSQNIETVLLQERVLPAVATISFGVSKVLCAVQFDDQIRIRAIQVCLQASAMVERNGQLRVQAESP